MEGFVQDSRYPRKRKLKWAQLHPEDAAHVALLNSGAENDPMVASHLAAMMATTSEEDASNPELMEGLKKAKLSRIPAGPQSAKESELILEKIKSVKVERLQKAINDQVTWSLLTQDVRDGVLAEYAKLLKS